MKVYVLTETLYEADGPTGTRFLSAWFSYEAAEHERYAHAADEEWRLGDFEITEMELR